MPSMATLKSVTVYQWGKIKPLADAQAFTVMWSLVPFNSQYACLVFFEWTTGSSVHGYHGLVTIENRFWHVLQVQLFHNFLQ